MATNPYAQYQNSKVLTASPAELTLMLYDGAIKFGNMAIAAMKENDVQKAHTNIVKFQRIIQEFRQTLDMKYPVAKDFDNIYALTLQRALEANIKKDPEIMGQAVDYIRSLRETWVQVMDKNKRGEV